MGFIARPRRPRLSPRPPPPRIDYNRFERGSINRGRVAFRARANKFRAFATPVARDVSMATLSFVFFPFYHFRAALSFLLRSSFCPATDPAFSGGLINRPTSGDRRYRVPPGLLRAGIYETSRRNFAGRGRTLRWRSEVFDRSIGNFGVKFLCLWGCSWISVV